MLILQCNIICHSFPLHARVVSRVKSNASSCMRNIIMTHRDCCMLLIRYMCKRGWYRSSISTLGNVNLQDIGPTTSRHQYRGLSVSR